MTLPESYYTFEEHMACLEDEHAKSDYCEYERPTGDKKWPVLCDRDNKYATTKDCERCKKRREENAESEL